MRLSNLRIFAALHEDIAEGFVWLKHEGLPARAIVKITYKGSGRSRSVYCEALQFEKNFLTTYNGRLTTKKIDSAGLDDSIVMNCWYRAKLGGDMPLKTQQAYSLCVKRANRLGPLCACMQHPQAVVRVAVRLGVVSLFLGLVSLGISVSSIPRVSHGIAAFFHFAMRTSVPETMASTRFQPPTATELFTLRSKCADLAGRLIADSEQRQGQAWADLLGSGSRYDPRSNRCYAWLRGTNVMHHVEGQEYVEAGEEAFDAQTGEFLAGSYARHNDSRSPTDVYVGEVTVRNWETLAASIGVPPDKIPKPPAYPRYDHNLAQAIIDKIMEDPRE